MRPQDKRFEENLRVRRAITDALFRLLDTKPLTKVTVTELVKEAGVARASFYRNYESREDVVSSAIDELLDEVSSRLSEPVDSPDPVEGICAFFTRDNLVAAFAFCLERRERLLALRRNGFGMSLQEHFDRVAETALGSVSTRDPRRYAIYLFTGAMQNLAMHWLVEGAVESPEYMADMFLGLAPYGSQ